MKGLSNRGAVKFGKVGRPANDPVEERLRIYRAAGPLILMNGVCGTTIKAVAEEACLSPGGIYHYFASKRQLVLYGLEPEALSRACLDASRDLLKSMASMQPSGCREVIRLYVDKNLRMLEFVRPTLQAAVELGRPELQDRLSEGIRKDADSLVTALRTLHPALAIAEDAANAIRRTILGLAVDDNVTPVEARRHLLWLFSCLVPSFYGHEAA